jgi:hypothetical protein
MPFEKGNKQGGRTEEGERLRKACRKVTEQAVRAWVEALEATDSEGAPDHDIRIKAAAHLMDRGYGKPRQEITGEDGGAIKVDASAGLLDTLKRLAGE